LAGVCINGGACDLIRQYARNLTSVDGGDKKAINSWGSDLQI